MKNKISNGDEKFNRWDNRIDICSELKEQCIDIHVPRTICEFPQFRTKPICKIAR